MTKAEGPGPGEIRFMAGLQWDASDLWRCWLLFALSFGTYGLLLLSGPEAPSLSPEQILLFSEAIILIGLLYGTWRRHPTADTFGLRPFSAEFLGTAVLCWAGVYLLGLLYMGTLVSLGLEPKTDLIQVLQQVDQRWLMFLIVGVAAPVLEELFFRGYLFAGLCRYLPWRGAAAISALAFSLIHADLYRAPILWLLGYLFAWLYRRSGSLWPAIVIHGLNNSVALVLLTLLAP